MILRECEILVTSVQFSSVQLWQTLCDPMDCSTPGFHVPSPTPRIYSNSYPLSWWCCPTISSSVIPFSSSLQSCQHKSLFQWISSLNQVAQVWSFSFSPSNEHPTKDWSPLGWTGWVSLQSKGLSGVSSNTPVQKHQFFGAWLSLYSKVVIYTWPLEKP